MIRLDYKKVMFAVIVIIFIVSNFFIIYDDESFGELKIIFTMVAIFTGLALMIMVIILNKSKNQKIEDPKDNFDFLIDEKKDIKLCNVCNKENKINSDYCIKCGSDIRDIICPICKTKNPYSQVYCAECDTILQNKKRHL